MTRKEAQKIVGDETGCSIYSPDETIKGIRIQDYWDGVSTPKQILNMVQGFDWCRIVRTP